LKYLRDRIGENEIPWDKWLDNLYRYALRMERQGIAPVEIATSTSPNHLMRPVFVVHGVTLMQKHQTTILRTAGHRQDVVLRLLLRLTLPIKATSSPSSITSSPKTHGTAAHGSSLADGLRSTSHYFAMTQPLVRDEDRTAAHV
jgi:hypothetical protein